MIAATDTSSGTKPLAMPSWITPALLADTKRIYGRKLHRILSDAEAVEIITNIANLMNALTKSRRHS
jgi:hypothetical protein